MFPEKSSVFLDNKLQSVMYKDKSYIRNSGHFLEKMKQDQYSFGNEILVTAALKGLRTQTFPIRQAWVLSLIVDQWNISLRKT